MMGRIKHKSHECIIPGACPSRWRATRKESGPEREARYKRLVAEGYAAVYQALGCHVHKRAKFSRADNVTLIALKRIAEKLYDDATRAVKIVDSRVQNSNEELARRAG